MEQLVNHCDKRHQILLFSATFPVTVKTFQEKYIPNPYSINLMDELTLKGVTQSVTLLCRCLFGSRQARGLVTSVCCAHAQVLRFCGGAAEGALPQHAVLQA